MDSLVLPCHAFLVLSLTPLKILTALFVLTIAPQKAVTAAPETIPPEAKKAFERAMSLREENKYKQALKVYDEIISKDKDNARAYQERGAVLAALGRYDDAIKQEKNALKLDPKLHLAHIYIGMIYGNKKRFLDAYSQLKQASEIKPDSYVIHMRLGVVCKRLKRLDEAKSEYEAAARLMRERSAPHRGLSAVSIDCGDIDAAVSEAEQAVKLESNAVNYNNLGTIFSVINRLDEATELLTKATQVDNQFVPAYITLARVKTLQGDYETARSLYEKAISIDKKDAGARHALRLLNDNSILRVKVVESKTSWVEQKRGYQPQVTLRVENLSGKDLTGKNLQLRARFENCRTSSASFARERLKPAFDKNNQIEIVLKCRKTFELPGDRKDWPDFQCTVMANVGDVSIFQSQLILDRLMSK